MVDTDLDQKVSTRVSGPGSSLLFRRPDSLCVFTTTGECPHRQHSLILIYFLLGSRNACYYDVPLSVVLCWLACCVGLVHLRTSDFRTI